MKKSSNSFIVFSFVLFISCDQQQTKANNQTTHTLALIGDKIITVNDFIKRCEYVPRPVYCKGNSYIHKKIALNSLIAEKLLSLEFDKKNFSITKNQSLIIQGHKEQAMRHLMLKKFGYEKVKIDNDEIDYLTKLSKRKYDISYITIDKKYEDSIDGLPNNISLLGLTKELNISNNIIKRFISKDDDMISMVQQILFAGNPDVDKVYGPFKVDKNKMLIFSIDGWTINPDITIKQKQDSWQKIENQYIEKKAKELYGRYVSQIMKGKTINYDLNKFDEFSDKLARIYLIEKEKKEAAIENKIWEIEEKNKVVSFNEVKQIENDFLLTHDGKDYTVLELLQLIKKHPLVFRRKNTNPELFKNELKYAIADLLRDMHITIRAYDLGLDKNINIINSKEKWEDHIKSIVMKNKFISILDTNNSEMGILNQNIDSLQSYYSHIIKIDTEKFEKIDLTRIDMNVMYSNQPYSKLEPDFPVLTNDHLLDYGEKIIFND
tara:strand:- start:858 stop:2333 length:1476 start_codon:yes stop_codon:yes gene_type:complete